MAYHPEPHEEVPGSRRQREGGNVHKSLSSWFLWERLGKAG